MTMSALQHFFRIEISGGHTGASFRHHSGIFGTLKEVEQELRREFEDPQGMAFLFEAERVRLELYEDERRVGQWSLYPAGRQDAHARARLGRRMGHEDPPGCEPARAATGILGRAWCSSTRRTRDCPMGMLTMPGTGSIDRMTNGAAQRTDGADEQAYFVRLLADHPSVGRTGEPPLMGEPEMQIRPFENEDWSGVWGFLEPIFRAGETYAYPRDISEEDARRRWTGAANEVFVAEDPSTGNLVGSYYLKRNYDGPGAHVCNCGYAVSPVARGKGIASLMCEHSQERAVHRGFRAMQFNLVAASNDGAVRLWSKLGFEIVGTLPGAFQHPNLGFVDAYVMFKTLSSAAQPGAPPEGAKHRR